MIIHEHKAIFVHIPKTAGTSIECLFGINVSDDITLNQNTFTGWDGYKQMYIQHCSIQQILDWSMMDLSNYFSFTFVRNPWDRIVSDYLFFKIRSDMSLKEFIVKEGVSDPTHVLPQMYFIKKRNGEIGLDFIGRFENLQCDFNTVCDKIGIERQTLPHMLKKQRKHYSFYYDDETVELIAKKYKEDIEYFGYEFENLK